MNTENQEPSSIKLVVFDLDDTLISMESAREVANDAFISYMQIHMPKTLANMTLNTLRIHMKQ